MQSILVFIDGTICDDRRRAVFYGTDDFYDETRVMEDRPVRGSAAFLRTLASAYEILYIGARKPAMEHITHQWLNMYGFPHGEVFLADSQTERLRLIREVLANRDIVLGIGDRWDDNQLHLELGCRSVIVREYEGDWGFVARCLPRIGIQIKKASFAEPFLE